MERINLLKQQKYTLEEIRDRLELWNKVSNEDKVTEKLSSLEIHLHQLEREVKELEPLISKLKPGQERSAFSNIMPQSLACIEALRILLNNVPFS
ncbi:hypothetical protein D3C81_1890030 [compost metagenome]